jgi:hypothetical protein
MPHSSRHRVAKLLLAAGYLAANVLGGWVHDHEMHDHADHADPAMAECCAHDAHHGHGEHHDDGATDALPAGVVSLTADDAAHGGHDDNCTICRAAGQRVLQAPGFQPDGVHAVSARLAVVLPANPVAPLARSIHSRAPPVGV